MSRSGPPHSPETEALLAREREIAPLPEALRERALARARGSLRSAAVMPPVIVRTPTRKRWAIAAGLFCVGSAAMAAAAYEIGVHWARAPLLSPEAKRPIPPARAPAGPAPAPSPPLTESDAAPSEQPTPGPRPMRQPVSVEELRLLRQARAAVARRDFSGALPPLVEHARRFREGRLAEEREALRVTALAGLGHTDDARRAARQFEAHYPRSVLLPAVERMANPER
jgi:hypothetical protein